MMVFPGVNEHPTRPGFRSPPLTDLGIKILLLILGLANGRGSSSRFHALKGLRHASNSLQQKMKKTTRSPSLKQLLVSITWTPLMAAHNYNSL